MKLKFGFPGKLLSKGKEKERQYCPYCPYNNPPTRLDGVWNEFKLAIIIFIAAVIILVTNILSYAQERRQTPLKVGDVLPEVNLKDVLNNPLPEIKISDYKNKLLILDFWFTRCGTCIEDMPGVAALQKRFGDKIKIIQIDFEKPEEVLKFYRYHPRLKDLGLPVACNDTLLKQLFPHIYSPHVIWIDHGVFIAATADDYLVAKNIDSVLNKRAVRLTAKVDRKDWDFVQPLYRIDHTAGLVSSTRVYGAVLGGYIAGVGSGGRLIVDSLTGDQRFDYLNYPVLNFYGQILQSGLPLTANRRILEVTDRSGYINEGQQYQDVWDAKHCYSFEATAPKGVSRDQLLLQMKALVEGELGVTGAIEKVNTEVLAIRFLHGLPPASTFKKQTHVLYPGLPMSYHHVSVKALVEAMNEKENLIPVIDETATFGQVYFDLDYPVMPENEVSWRKTLKANGLELVRCKRAIEMFVLKEDILRPVLSPAVFNQH
ncbi:TlpA family protein disulfide reductase [Mucilaginibacter sp. McL0603]|uniref:TlpA family protein disulfide reductase n=1 Tax=Mucilaginibacter sp. McL0603 TaxID=3415670 RepID=UPI003CE8B416